MIDVAAFIGPYPFRHLPHPDPDVLARVLQREGLSGAWVGYLPSPWQRDPTPGNEALFQALGPYPTLRFAPVVRPNWPSWEHTLRQCVDAGAAAIRAYPMHWGLGPHDPSMQALAGACGEIGIPLVLMVRFEDLRQRSALDVAGDLTAAHIRALARSGNAKLVVTGAGRELLEETHWGLTPAEQARVHWDFAWIWGPPEDHFAHLIRTIGAERFVYGTHWPLRLTQNARANLDLLPDELRNASITDAESLATPRVGKTLT
ncbi:MAG: amidohydrolase 2 [Gemmatimonadetes bacterium]|nr:amidohydrolase 2 [Gemmatimonadota bacterium]